MSTESNIIGHDCDGRPIPAGALVVAISDPAVVKPEHLGAQFHVVGPADAAMKIRALFAGLDGNLLLCDDGGCIRDCSVRLVQDKHQPADEDFQADLQQWLGQKQESKV